MFSQLFAQPQPRNYRQPYDYHEPEYEDMDDDEYGFPQQYQQHQQQLKQKQQQNHKQKHNQKQRAADPRRHPKPASRQAQPPKQQQTFIPVRSGDQPEAATIVKKPVATTPTMDKERAVELIQARAMGHAIRKSEVLKRLKQLKELRAKVDILKEQYEHKFLDGTASEQDALVYSECLTRELITLDTFDSKHIRPHRRAVALYIEKLMQVVDQWKMLDNKTAGVAKPEGLLPVDSPVTSDESLELDQEALDYGLEDSESDNELDGEVASPEQVEQPVVTTNDPSSDGAAQVEAIGETSMVQGEPKETGDKASPVPGSPAPPAEPMQVVENDAQGSESPLSGEINQPKEPLTEPVSSESEVTTEPAEPACKAEQEPLAAHFFPAQQTQAGGNRTGHDQVKKVHPRRREADDEGYTEKLLRSIRGDYDQVNFLPTNFRGYPRYSYYRPGFAW